MAKRADRGALKKRRQMRIQMEELKRLNESTFYYMGQIMFTNAARNIASGLMDEQGVEVVKSDYWHGEGRGARFNDLFGLIVAGGPSLNIYKHLEMLKKVYPARKFTIFAVDRVLGELCELGIYPDYVFSVDVQPETAEFYEVLKVSEHRIALEENHTMGVFAGNIDPAVRELWGLRRCFFWISAPFGSHIEASQMWDMMVPLGVLNSLGHVTGVALNVASQLDLRVLGAIGCDYSYEPGQRFEEGPWYNYLSKQGRSDAEIRDTLKPETFKDPITGEEIVTDALYMNYVAYILNFLETREPHLRFYNCSERGLLYNTKPEEQLVKPIKFGQWLELVDKHGGGQDGQDNKG